MKPKEVQDPLSEQTFSNAVIDPPRGIESPDDSELMAKAKELGCGFAKEWQAEQPKNYEFQKMDDQQKRLNRLYADAGCMKYSETQKSFREGVREVLGQNEKLLEINVMKMFRNLSQH